MSTFPFSTTIPAANNDPADDQPLMLINNSSTSGLVAVDHVGFNVTAGGFHKQITFASNNVPSPPASPPVLFTNDVNALPELFFYSGDAAHSSTQYVAAGNGSSLQLGGVVLKWGTASFSGTNSTLVVNFVSAFPNNCFFVGPIPESALAAGAGTGFAISSVTTSGFTITRQTSVVSGLTIRYSAIGN